MDEVSIHSKTIVFEINNMSVKNRLLILKILDLKN